MLPSNCSDFNIRNMNAFAVFFSVIPERNQKIKQKVQMLVLASIKGGKKPMLIKAVHQPVKTKILTSSQKIKILNYRENIQYFSCD